MRTYRFKKRSYRRRYRRRTNRGFARRYKKGNSYDGIVRVCAMYTGVVVADSAGGAASMGFHWG